MPAKRSSGYAYARASARGVLFGLLISIAIVAPFAINAAQPADQRNVAAHSADEPTTQPDPTTQLEPTTQPETTPEPTPEPTLEPTTTPTAAPTAGPTAAATPAPTDEPSPSADPTSSVEPTQEPPPSASPVPLRTVEYLVTFASSAAFAERGALFAALGATEAEAISPLRIAAVDVPFADAAATAAALRTSSGVAAVELGRERTIESAPSDALFADQWALPRIGWDNVYDTSTPSGQSVVAILDTGVDGAHPDLAGLLVHGATFAGNAPADTDANGHGTQMAGIVAARVDNAEGVAGVAFDGVRLMPVTVLGADGTGSDADIIAGLVWAVDHGADVVLMSFSSPSYSPALQAALDYAWDHDVVLVAATGNDGVSTVTYPAGDRGVIGVSNTDEDDALNSSSNHGSATFLGAPGTSIVTTSLNDGYLSITGTSAAAAMVAGAAGLVRAFDPAATNGQVVYRLAISADDVASVEDVGNGRLDVAGAVGSTATDFVQPSGAGVLGDGGPIVEPYVAAACVWVGTTSTAWENAANWSGCLGAGGLPGATDSASIGSTTFAPTISASTGTAIVRDLTIAAGVTVTMTGGTFEIWHDWKNSGTFNGTGGTVQFRASGGGGPDFSASNQFYDILIDAGVDPAFDNTAASVINISHDFTNNSTALSATTAATFVFNGTGAQSIYSAVTGTAATFGNLTVNKSGGTLALTSNANVTGVVTITAGTVDLSTFTMNRPSNGASFNMSAGTLLRVGGSAGPTGFTTSTLNATSTVEYYGGAQTVSSLNYGNLTLNNGNTKTAAAAITVTGTFLIDTSTTFAASTFTHNIGGALTVNGTFSPSTGTASFNGSSDQAINGSTTPITFNNLTVNKTGTLSTSNNLSIAGNLTVTAGILDLGASTANRTSAGGTLSVAAGATLKIGGTNGFPTSFTTNTLNATSTVDYNGTAQTVAAQTYGHLTLSGGSTKTPASGLTVNGDFTIAINTTFAAGSLTHTFGANFINNGTFTPSTSTAAFTNIVGAAIGGTTQTTFATISITTGVITLNTSATATALTFQNNAAANSFTHASGVDLTVNGNVTITQASGGTVVHAWNVNAGTATVIGNVTFSVTAGNAGRVARLAITTGTVSVQGDVVMTNALLAANSVIDMSGGSGTLNLGGALTVTTLGTLTPGTSSTVVYDGTGAQTVTLASAITYNTIKIDKPSGTATLGAAITAANSTNITLQQGTLAAGGFNMNVDGTWTNNGGTFSGGATTVTFSGTVATIAGTASTDFPAVSIAASAVVAMNNSNTATSLAFVATGAAQSLTHASGTTFTVSGTVTLNQPTGSFTSAWNINAATATTNGLITFAGTNTTAARLAKIVITTGTLNANAGMTFTASVAAGKVIDMSGGAGTLNLKGALTVPALSSTLTAGTAGSTFVYADTAAQTINYFSAGAYHNLSVTNSNASGAALSAAISATNVTGNVRVLTGGVFANGGFAIVGNAAKTFEVQDGATFRLSGTSAWPTGFGTFTLGGGSNSSTVEYTGGAQNVAATATIVSNYDNLTLSGSTVTKTLLGSITADALLTVGSTVTMSMADKNATVGSLTGAGTVQFGNGAVANTFTVGSDGTSTTFSGVFNSTNDSSDVFVKNGAGTLTVSNTHTFTGTYKASAGTLLLTGTLATTSTSTLDGGILAGTGSAGIISGSSNGGTLGPGNPASSTGTFSTRNFAFAAQSTYSIQVNGTTAGTNYDQTSVTGTVNLASATLSMSLGYAPSVGDSYTIIANDSTDAVTGTFSGQAEGSTITASGIAFTVSYVGGTGNDVTLTVGSITDTWTGAVSTSWSTAGNWQDNRAPSAGHILVFPSGATSFTPNNDIAAATTFAAITVSGSGYTISGNSITLGSGNMTASYASGSSTISMAVILPADRTVTVTNSSATLTLSGIVSGAFTLTKAGSGTLALSNANTYGATTISAGTLQIGSGSTTGTLGSGNVTNNAALSFNRSDTWTVSNTISGSGTVSKIGAGTLTLSSSNSYSGATTISAGTLKISADNNLGTAPGSATAGHLTFSGGTLATTASFTLHANRGIAFSSTGILDVASSTTLTYNGIAAGSGGLTKASTGILILGGANSYSGATGISAGTLRHGAANVVPSGSALNVTGGATYDLNGNNSTIGSLAGAGNVTLGSATLNAGGDNTSTSYSGTMTPNTGGLTKSGSGTLDLGSASITVGALTISAGVITAPGSGGTFSVSGAWTNNASTSGLTANNGTVTLDGSSSQSIGGSFVTTFKNLRVNNAAGASLSVGVTVNGTLTLAGGNVTTGASNLYIASGGSVSRTSGHIVGNLKKYVATGSPTVAFEIGSASAYAPVSLTFGSVSVAGDLTASTTSSDHANISTSLLNSAKSANRYWTLTNSGITFTNYSATVTFVAGDVDGGADPTAFFINRYTGSAWDMPQTTSRTSTTTTATGITGFGDLITAESTVAAPGSLASSAVSTRRIDLTWLDNASTETGYAVEKGTDGVNYSAYTTTAANAVGSSVTGLTANTTYYFRVRTVTATSYSAWVYVSGMTLTVPVAVADSYSTSEGVVLAQSAPGVLANDPDYNNGFYVATKVTDPSSGSVTLNTDGSFTYTPNASFSGTDSFTYRVDDGALHGNPVTVTITVSTSAYVPVANWPTSANSSRYIEMAFPAYIPSGATVHDATFHHKYRTSSATPGYTVCYYFEVYDNTTLIGTHGSSGSPVSCQSGGSYVTDDVALPEVNTVSRANNLKIRLIVWSSGGGKSEHRLGSVTVDYQLN